MKQNKLSKTKHSILKVETFPNIWKTKSNLMKILSVFFVSQGIVSLLIWSVVNASFDYFLENYEPYHFTFTMPILGNLSCLFIFPFTEPINKRFTMKQKMMASHIGITATIVTLPLYPFILGNGVISFSFEMMTFFFGGLFNCVQIAAVSGFLGFFSPRQSANYFLGCSLGGIGFTIARAGFVFLYYELGKIEEEVSSYEILSYYFFAVFIMVFALVLYLQLDKKKLFVEESPKIPSEISEKEEDLAPRGSFHDSHVLFVPIPEEKPKEEPVETKRHSLDGVKNKVAKNQGFHETFQLIKVYFWWLFLTMALYCQTAFIDPGLLLNFKLKFADLTWSTILMVLIFSVFDCIGRYSGNLKITQNSLFIHLFVLARFGIILGYILQIYFYNDGWPVIGTDWFNILLNGLIALTGGYGTTLLFVYTINLLPKKQKEIGGSFISFFQMLGMTFGAFMAIPFSGVNSS